MNNLYLFQPQYHITFGAQLSYWLPYSAACIWSYVSQFEEISNNYSLKEIIYKREPHSDILSRLDNPSVCGFSCYVWNERYCLELAKEIKKLYPSCIIVFGGPQPNSSYNDYDFIDAIIYGEGERSFKTILDSVSSGKLIEKIWDKDRLPDPNYPSPYLTGIFDTIISDNPSVTWHTVIETNRGCPYQCTFCDWGSAIYTKIRKFNLTRVEAEIKWLANNSVSYVFVADANFGIFKDRDLEIANYLRAAVDSPNSKIDALTIQFAKNSNETVFEIGKILGNTLRGITFSVQSMNDDTLTAIKRKNMQINKLNELLELGDKSYIPTYSELILGLPLETIETWKTGLADLLENGQHSAIDVWFAQLLPNSELASVESMKKYGIKSVIAQEYISFDNVDDYPETIELICETDTMSRMDMVECYVYSWMIVHFHIHGYTQLLAKYARNILNISYRDFYDTLFMRIKLDKVFGPLMSSLSSITGSYLLTGRYDTPNEIKAHSMIFYGASDIHANKDHAISLLQEEFNIPDDICELQKYYVASSNQDSTIEVDSSVDISSWTNKPSKYKITSKVSLENGFDFFSLRRKGLLKNTITSTT